MEFTNEFINTKRKLRNTADMPKITPDRIFYEIDDFTITQDTVPVNTTTGIKNVKELWGDKLKEYIKDKYIGFEEVPVLTQEAYLRELKDCQYSTPPRKPERFWLKGNNSTETGWVVILNKYPDHYVLMSEVYVGGKFKQAMEFNLDVMIEEFNNL